jgi:UDP-glucose 4-epimerase
MRDAFTGVHAVIHTAGIAHAMSGIPEDDYRALNTEATVALARAAFACGVKRFIFLSSVRAQSGPSAQHVLNEGDEPCPTDAYGRSKLAAERGVAQLDGDWVALRLPLTYGAGVKGNFARLHRLALSPYPLPFAGINARRSILSLANLVSALNCVLDIDRPLRRPLLVADPQALSMGEMISIMRRALGRSPRLFWIPPSLLERAFATAGRAEEYLRIAEPLEVSTAALQHLSWRPIKSTEEALTGASRSLGLA